MNTIRTLIIVAAIVPMMSAAQERYGTRSGEVTFFSATPMENIDAVNHAVACVYDVTSATVEASMLMKAFEFKKEKMQADFNEDYVESDKFPKSVLNGKVTGFGTAHLKKQGSYKAKIDGDLTLHGVTQHVTLDAQIAVGASGALTVTSDFIVKPEDYKIAIPAVVRDHIAKEVQVKVRMDLNKL
jgi:predicted RNase H-related nuclease YkuK (DUF458 family)